MAPFLDQSWHGLATSDFGELAQQYGTPYYLYDADVVADRIERVRSALQGRCKVLYAVKANPNLELLRSICEDVDGLDVSSGGELEQALAAGYDPGRISFAGPAKTTEELLASLRCGLGSVSVESMRELAELSRLSKELGVVANIVLRVNPRLTIREFGMKMGGKPVQFGIDEEDLGPAVDVIRQNEASLNFRGIHVYTGSQCFKVSGVEKSVTDTIRLARELESSQGLRCRTLNFGGGFGVAHGAADRELDVAALGESLVPRFDDAVTSNPDLELIFELGRYLVADAGIYVTRVVSSKCSRGTEFCVVDGGLHHHLAAGGMFGVGLRSNYDLRNLSRPTSTPTRISIAGPLCNPTDLLGVNVDLPKPEIGDLIGVLKSGSYSFSASPLLFLGRRTPAELVRHRGSVRLGRRSRSMAEFN